MAEPTCAVCGEPMPPGETMFKFHGYSGPCPKPPLPKAPHDASDACTDQRLRELWKEHGGKFMGSSNSEDPAQAVAEFGLLADILRGVINSVARANTTVV